MTTATRVLPRPSAILCGIILAVFLSGCAVTDEGELCYVTSAFECQVMEPQRGRDSAPAYVELDAIPRNAPGSTFVNPAGTWEGRPREIRYRRTTVFLEFSDLNGNFITGYVTNPIDSTTFWDYDGSNTWYARGPDIVARFYDNSRGQVWMPDGATFSIRRAR